ncbi:hypothetical protein PTRG_01758 [Pyrenophora tritici-repentis Pt-1C-BFP]|uniref:Uncharacterized protein n=1 Tax=Pyrenophora tritici-repentis (strain Pt-1C-BFP) TaxID=426418 RepID=B2VSD2_PYRTR|nr:uncharacterized protein PTRG_01758 [Pyrenophora tritici-repentis Pt-1C-BFP]EDU41196.1 hypothetical protein PTRG_01758 [Pyrenophora tritici-repentis Pt-1C-BFP]
MFVKIWEIGMFSASRSLSALLQSLLPSHFLSMPNFLRQLQPNPAQPDLIHPRKERRRRRRIPQPETRNKRIKTVSLISTVEKTKREQLRMYTQKLLAMQLWYKNPGYELKAKGKKQKRKNPCRQ